jgi:hypothetical protein
VIGKESSCRRIVNQLQNHCAISEVLSNHTSVEHSGNRGTILSHWATAHGMDRLAGQDGPGGAFHFDSPLLLPSEIGEALTKRLQFRTDLFRTVTLRNKNQNLRQGSVVEYLIVSLRRTGFENTQRVSHARLTESDSGSRSDRRRGKDIC